MPAAKACAELPNLFRFNNGTPVTRPRDWPRRRRELADAILPLEYGGMPPIPKHTSAEFLHDYTAHPPLEYHYRTYRVRTGPSARFTFLLYLFIPAGKGPFPVVLTGDACWRYTTEPVISDVLRRGYLLAQFNRVELAPDIYQNDRTSGLYPFYPRLRFGALSAWAWGYHRCVDVLSRMECVNPSQIAIVGHSRGGKTVLLAGATDERIALTAPNNSGAGGAGCYRWQGPKSETLADTMRMIPYWFGPHLHRYVGNEDRLPFDQHFLKAMIAPRACLSTEALGDLWANPTGTLQTHLAAREVYRFLGVESRIGIRFRPGEHNHGPADWKTFLDFADWQFRNKHPRIRFDENPFPRLSPAFKWSAPNR